MNGEGEIKSGARTRNMVPGWGRWSGCRTSSRQCGRLFLLAQPQAVIAGAGAPVRVRRSSSTLINKEPSNAAFVSSLAVCPKSTPGCNGQAHSGRANPDPIGESGEARPRPPSQGEMGSSSKTGPKQGICGLGTVSAAVPSLLFRNVAERRQSGRIEVGRSPPENRSAIPVRPLPRPSMQDRCGRRSRYTPGPRSWRRHRERQARGHRTKALTHGKFQIFAKARRRA